MKTRIYHSSLLAVFVSLTISASAAPLGGVITYQGVLKEGGSAYTGNAEFQATVWDAANGGVAVGTNAAGPVVVSVSSGLFVLPLDFGTSCFSAGEERWLQLEVRTAIGAFNPLTPRQKLSATPFALYAPSAGTAQTASAVAASAVTGAGIAPGQVVRSLNGLQDSVRLLPGTNVSLVAAGDSITVSATPGTVVTNAG
jgi:hypothetical protein